MTPSGKEENAVAGCTYHESCPFYKSIAPNIAKRIKYAAAFPYCRGAMSDACALHIALSRGDQPPLDTLPDGSHEIYANNGGSLHHAHHAVAGACLVVEDSPVFATLAANTLSVCAGGAEVIKCASYAEAEEYLNEANVRLIVCGYGIGDGKTVHDIRRLSEAPIVLMTGRLGDITTPSRSKVVEKSAGPEALRTAIIESLN